MNLYRGEGGGGVEEGAGCLRKIHKEGVISVVPKANAS